MKGLTSWALLLLMSLVGCASTEKKNPSHWKLTEEARALVHDEKLVGQIFWALDAAQGVGTDPGISRFHVRAATVLERGGKEYVIAGGNTEYEVPEAIHGETSLLNHVTALLGPEATRQSVRFIAFYSQQCGESLDRKSTRLNSSHIQKSRMPSSA